jgi:hypothetical protein
LKYAKLRIYPLKLILLAGLLSLMVFRVDDDLLVWLSGTVFLLISLLVFRVVDDAGSVYPDRKDHPERDYLNEKNYTAFLIITSVISLIYLITIWFFEHSLLPYLASLLFVSVLLYMAFRHFPRILMFIPLLKYPVLLFCAGLIASREIPVEILIASFLILYAHDEIELFGKYQEAFRITILLLLVCGILLFPLQDSLTNILLILTPVILLLAFRKKPYLRFMPVLYFPIAFFIMSNI